MILKKQDGCGLYLTGTGQGPVAGCSLHVNELSGSIKCQTLYYPKQTTITLSQHSTSLSWQVSMNKITTLNEHWNAVLRPRDEEVN